MLPYIIAYLLIGSVIGAFLIKFMTLWNGGNDGIKEQIFFMVICCLLWPVGVVKLFTD